MWKVVVVVLCILCYSKNCKSFTTSSY